MNGIRLGFTLIALFAVLALSLGPFAAPAFADGTASDNGQDPPAALPSPVEVIMDDAGALVRVLVSVIL